MSLNDSDDGTNHFQSMRKQDKEAYERRQTDIADKFGFEEAQPKPASSE